MRAYVLGLVVWATACGLQPGGDDGPASDLATADLSTPDLATPDLSTPDLATPDLSTPDLSVPVPAPDLSPAHDLSHPPLDLSGPPCHSWSGDPNACASGRECCADPTGNFECRAPGMLDCPFFNWSPACDGPGQCPFAIPNKTYCCPTSDPTLGACAMSKAVGCWGNEAGAACNGSCPSGETCVTWTNPRSGVSGMSCKRLDITCANGVIDGTESDLDCGGWCAPCANGQQCHHWNDCAGSNCVAGVCAPWTPPDMALPPPDLAPPPPCTQYALSSSQCGAHALCCATDSGGSVCAMPLAGGDCGLSGGTPACIPGQCPFLSFVGDNYCCPTSVPGINRCEQSGASGCWTSNVCSSDAQCMAGRTHCEASGLQKFCRVN